MKKLLLFFAILFSVAAHAGPMANVEYVHKVIEQQWDIEVPYNPVLENPRVAANMKYLLTAIDVANKMLNGAATSDYGNSKYATMYAADTIATNEAVKRLIMDLRPQFFVTTTASTSSFYFKMSAKGTFLIDWGDGNTEKITRTDTAEKTYSHTYSAAGEYTIGIGGKATGYYSDSNSAPNAPISFRENNNVAGITGSLGAVFSTVGDGSTLGQQPRFYNTFYNCANLKGEIPENLFAGITGAPVERMFYSTFQDSKGLTKIPAELFAGLKGAPAKSMFANTFSGCNGLTQIQAGLFRGIEGAPAEMMFANTFYNCSGLKGSIPSTLFSGIEGAPAERMFAGTFSRCSGLTGEIPENLFSGIEGAPAERMFAGTFNSCSGLTGEIPENLFADIEGAPANSMFSETFRDCSGLSGEIPARLFGTFSGAPAKSMFFWTFYNCRKLSGCIPAGLFAGIDATLKEIIAANDPFSSSGITQTECAAFTPEFMVTTTDNTSNFSFNMSAAGEFTVDWGDGNIEKITRTDTAEKTYSHTYGAAGRYTIGIGGKATGYSADDFTAAISFLEKTNVAGISGSLGAIFGTIGDGSVNGQQPRFYMTFSDNTNLTGSIPENLFAGITGAPATSMFMGTFAECSGLTGSIPTELFAGIEGAPASSMFMGTFAECSGLTGSIPAGLFAGIEGAPAEGMFMSTFVRCSGLTQIPDGLFAGIEGAPAEGMFTATFSGCSGLSGPSARINGVPLYDIWTDWQAGTSCYQDATGLSDYADIPSDWR